MSQLDHIPERIAHLRSRIPPHVEIMAVSKGYSAEHIRVAYQAGIRHFGESRVQEASLKQSQVQDLDIIWHLIGHLQTNKVSAALSLFDWIDSVDSLKLAQLLHQRLLTSPRTPQLCLQMKLAPDPQKYGWTVPELLQTLPQLMPLTRLSIRGLMSILPLGLSDPQILSLFQKLPQLANHLRSINESYFDIQVLSMGMSGDYPLAIAAGANLIRLGRFLFADPLPTPD
ncbi:MAG: YggS family pyridoxal phosphate-dependent enzyme [Cyanobacteriota bacterium]|nr:YggS family pyridoxal phosphate-dependent enzyme [Cyanobacteriota bacterium]